jgi:hypothetical protein
MNKKELKQFEDCQKITSLISDVIESENFTIETIIISLEMAIHKVYLHCGFTPEQICNMLKRQIESYEDGSLNTASRYYKGYEEGKV